MKLRISAASLFSRPFVSALLLAFGWLLVLRVSYSLQSGIWPAFYLSLPADIAGALVLAVLLSVTGGLWRVVFVVLLAFGAYTAGQHLSVHGTLFRLYLVGQGVNPTFFLASFANTQLILLPIYVVYAVLLHWLHRRLVAAPPAHRKPLILSAGIAVLIYGIAFQSLTTPANNLVASAFAQLPGALLSPLSTSLNETTPDPELTATGQERFFHQHLAESAVDEPPNVLLVMIEGLSGAYFPGVSEYHGLEPTIELGILEEQLLRQDFRLYRNALSMERQTNRGTFAILCGAYPDVRRQPTKMLDTANELTTTDCVPEKLKTAGYHTAYWQAAPLGYMEKATFMPRIGFTNVTGAEVFSRDDEIEGWGPTDSTYFANIGDRLLELDHDREPWFVTLLNVGTHHPYQVDETDSPTESSLTPQSPQEARRRAMEVMAETLAGLLDDLESNGLLNDTLVLITSDESAGFVHRDHHTMPLNNNIGVLAVRPPASASLERYAGRDRIVAQIDIPLTILDAAGLGDRAGDMIGRSLLASRDKVERSLLLADTYTGMKFFMRDSGQLLACTELTTRCTTWGFNPERLFGSLTRSDNEPFLTLQERLAVIDRANYMEPLEPSPTEEPSPPREP